MPTSAEEAVCAAAGIASPSAIASATAAAVLCCIVSSSRHNSLILEECLVDREVDHHRPPLIVLEQQYIGQGMALLHLRPNTYRKIAGVVVLGFLYRFPELARRTEHVAALLLCCSQVVTAGDQLGLGDLARAMVDDHFAILVTVFDNVHGELRLAVLDLKLG